MMTTLLLLAMIALAVRRRLRPRDLAGTTALAILIAPAIALADGGSVLQSEVARLLDLVITVIAPVAAVLGTYLAWRLSQLIRAKTGVDIGELLERIASEAIGYAEEQAHKAVRVNGAAIKGPEKLELALRHGLDLAERYGAPGWARERLRQLIEARLGSMRGSMLMIGTEVVVDDGAPGGR